MVRKELKNKYKSRVEIGGIFAIKNTVLNKWYVDKTTDLAAAKNRFDFMGDSYIKIANDFKAQNGAGFVFETLEELQKGETQSDREFQDDLSLLKTMWLEKLTGQELY